MNIKVVIIWAIAVVIFAGVGIFGYMNQDLLNKVNPNDVYVPNDAGENNLGKSCTKTEATYTNAYRFQMDENNQISRVIITHTATSTNVDAYTAASNINMNASSINGITASFQGGTSDFLLIVTIDIQNYDRVAIENIRADLTKLDMIVDIITNYDAYQTAINAATTGNSYICD